MKWPRMTMVSALCLMLSWGVQAASAELEALNDRLAKIVAEHVPEATVQRDDGKLTAKHGTMTFTVHQRWMTGEVDEKTHQVEGPNFKGFMLSVTMEHGAYRGQAVVPQTLNRPYWQTFIDRPATEDGKGHFVINFSYGSRLDKALKDAIFKALPSSLKTER